MIVVCLLLVSGCVYVYKLIVAWANMSFDWFCSPNSFSFRVFSPFSFGADRRGPRSRGSEWVPERGPGGSGAGFRPVPFRSGWRSGVAGESFVHTLGLHVLRLDCMHLCCSCHRLLQRAPLELRSFARHGGKADVL